MIPRTLPRNRTFLVIHVNAFTRQIDSGYTAFLSPHDGNMTKGGLMLYKDVIRYLSDNPTTPVDFQLI
jgi:hypothetical protein